MTEKPRRRRAAAKAGQDDDQEHCTKEARKKVINRNKTSDWKRPTTYVDLKVITRAGAAGRANAAVSSAVEMTSKHLFSTKENSIPQTMWQNIRTAWAAERDLRINAAQHGHRSN